MKREQPGVVSKLTFKARDNGSWQLRRAAVGALAVIGQGAPPTLDGGKGVDPDKSVVTTLLEILRSDNCALVRRAAIDGLILVGPVAQSQQADWRKALDNVLKPTGEKDKINQLWVRVLIIRNDPNGLKGNEAHLNTVADALKADDPVMRIEGCHALGVLGEEAKTKLQGLLDLIRDVNQPIEVSAAAMMAVTTMKSQDQIIMPVLQNAARTNPRPELQKVASEAITALLKK
jgi:HEAT repeat protein